MKTPLSALVLLHAQRHFLEKQRGEADIARQWRTRLLEARAAGRPAVLMQWDGPAGSDHETFSRGWTIHPDLRPEESDWPTRAP
ncbi:hypothetical protein ACFP81_05585 [Deinococcus lacus]|uniref:Isochorismatase n=1 Tax=Deinococcus lacus TaxID=392561 RepID=A0ABW1YDB2_9DEIO